MTFFISKLPLLSISTSPDYMPKERYPSRIRMASFYLVQKPGAMVPAGKAGGARE
jgi:hypothetical protein